jgi:hypothetical protein
MSNQAAQRSLPSARFARLRAWLARPTAVYWIIAASVAVLSIAIPSGLVLDDMMFAVALGDDAAIPSAQRAPWDAFAWAKEPVATQRSVDAGIYAWWSDLHARYAFFRPLTSLSLWLDYRMWPDTPALMHIHSLFWHVVLLFVLAAVYRRFAGPSGLGWAGLALAAYALDDTRSMPAGWIADRSAELSLIGALLALLAHDSWRKTQRVGFLVLSLAAVACAVLCAEAGVQAAAFLGAYALFMDKGTLRARSLSLVPAALLLVAWRVMYLALGYGAAGTALYIDPARDPLRFAEKASTALPLLLGSQFWGVSSELHDMLKYVAPDLKQLIVPLDCFGIAILVWLIAPLWKRRAEVRFWATSTLLTTLPVCAAMPSDRLLTATGVGGSALVATVVLALLDRAELFRPRFRAFCAATFGVINLLVAPLLLPYMTSLIFQYGNYIENVDKKLPDGPALAGKTLVLLNVPGDDYGMYMPFNRATQGRTLPKYFRWLATTDNDLELTRLDAHSLQVRPGRGFLPPGSYWLLRSPDHRSSVGDTLELSEVTFRVTEVTDDGRPASVIVRFDQPLDDDNFVWMRWSEQGGFVPFTPPQPGTSTHVAAVPFESVLNTL